jgi:hypothetical protein
MSRLGIIGSSKTLKILERLFGTSLTIFYQILLIHLIAESMKTLRFYNTHFEVS